ncbi:2Fe-2S iron-sulfur cluster-binding protein [Marinibaculum pumilum]|uniref:2Fe-2S iron-sulfur cluster-binding protein n=1 Tax=Marinibaculum pumilum TaxID=1766165 RepID=A0ABV7KVP4_9PROT
MTAQEAAITFTLNGRKVTASAEPRTHLADFLRETHLQTGTHLGCEQGVCGACTLFVDGRPVRSCITPAIACQDAEVRSVEGFEEDALMARLRAAFTRHHGLQCGFCTPGMLATAYDIVRRIPDADAARIRRELSGNLCRCTGYAGIVAAIEEVLAGDPPAAAVVPLPRRGPPAIPSAPADQPAIATAAAPADRAPGLPSLDAEIDGAVPLSRSLILDAPPDKVWPLLQDVPAMVACIPGASLDGPVENGRFRGRCTVAIGPMRASFGGEGAVRYDTAGRSGRLAGSGRDAASRSSLLGRLDFALTAEAGGGSRLVLDLRYRLTGPLAQFGRPAIVEGIADRLLADLAAALAARAAGRAPPAAESPKALGGLRLLGAALAGLVRRALRRG